jgi:hypothetical protein
MAIIEVNDILIRKNNEWKTLGGSNIYLDSKWNILKGGSGVYKDGNWYVFPENKPFTIQAEASTGNGNVHIINANTGSEVPSPSNFDIYDNVEVSAIPNDGYAIDLFENVKYYSGSTELTVVGDIISPQYFSIMNEVNNGFNKIETWVRFYKPNFTLEQGLFTKPVQIEITNNTSGKMLGAHIYLVNNYQYTYGNIMDFVSDGSTAFCDTDDWKYHNNNFDPSKLTQTEKTLNCPFVMQIYPQYFTNGKPLLFEDNDTPRKATIILDDDIVNTPIESFSINWFDNFLTVSQPSTKDEIKYVSGLYHISAPVYKIKITFDYNYNG